MAISIGQGLAILSGVLLLIVGAVAMARPLMASEQFGVRAEHPSAIAFMRAIGARDGVSGGALVVIALLGPRLALGIVLLISSAIAITDLVLTTRAGGPARARIVHGIGVAGLIGAGALVLAGH